MSANYGSLCRLVLTMAARLVVLGRMNYGVVVHSPEGVPCTEYLPRCRPPAIQEGRVCSAGRQVVPMSVSECDVKTVSAWRSSLFLRQRHVRIFFYRSIS